MNNLVLLQAAAQGAGYMQLLLLGGMVVVMYFFMFRPQMKRAKLQKQFGAEIKTGDRIVTMAGIHGRITKINEDGTMQLEIDRNSFMTVERSAISMEMTQALQKRLGAATTTA